MENFILQEIIASLSSEALKYFFPGYVLKEGRKSLYCSSSKLSGLAEIEADFSECEAMVCPMMAEMATQTMEDEFLEDEEPDSDERLKALVAEIEAIQKKYGVTIEELEIAMSYTVKLSHLRITRHHQIILDDFDHQEVKMDTLTKAVFLLYLKHPEGIRFKDLCDHKGELESIYMSISGRSDLAGIRKSICDLTDSIMSNSINEKVSKVKKAFRDVVDERISKFYFIDGEKGAAKKIALDRSLVIWE